MISDQIVGYAVLAVNEDGTKAQCRQLQSIDVRLNDLGEFSPEEVLIPDDVKDCLVMCFFSLNVWKSSWEYEEYDAEINLESFTVMVQGFKEYDRKQIATQITSLGNHTYPREFSEDEKEWFDEILEDWETLYDESFELPQAIARQQKPNEVEAETGLRREQENEQG